VLGLVDVTGAEMDGESLLPLAKSGGAPLGGIARSWLNSRNLTAIQRGNQKLIVGEFESELFDLAMDPGEKRNLATSDSVTMERLLGEIERDESHPGGSHRIDIPLDKRAELEALGYSVDSPQ